MQKNGIYLDQYLSAFFAGKLSRKYAYSTRTTQNFIFVFIIFILIHVAMATVHTPA